MITIVNMLRDSILPSLPILAIVLIAIWIGKLIRDLLTRYRVDEELTVKDNSAVGLALMGYYVGLAVALAGVLLSPSAAGLKSDIIGTLKYSGIAIVLLNISAYVNDKLILYRFDNQKELVEDQNAGTGAAMAGSYIATGLIVNAAVGGEGGGITASLIFFVLGQIVLVLSGLWYQLITKYDVHKVIGEDNNVAAGIAFGGFLFAMGYLARAAMLGDFISWGTDITAFVLYVIVALILLTIGRLISDRVFLPRASLSAEIGEQANIAAAEISVAIYIAVAVLVVSAV